MTFDETVSRAYLARNGAHGLLNAAANQIGMTQESQWSVANQQQSLMGLIEAYVKAEAKVQVLEILKSEDFYIAMSRSAAAVGE